MNHAFLICLVAHAQQSRFLPQDEPCAAVNMPSHSVVGLNSEAKVFTRNMR